MALIGPIGEEREDLKESMDRGPVGSPSLAVAASDVAQYEDLRSAVLTRYPEGSLKTILFTSTSHGEGSSTTAFQFAASLAKDPHLKVLLIDANLRSPGIPRILKIHNGHKLSDLVADTASATHLVKVGQGTLHVIPCGGEYSDPASLFESGVFDTLLKSARGRYDYVVLDAPPILGFSECRVLCAMVDGVVLVIESGKTRLQVAMSAKKQLEDAGGRILGVVLNKRKYYIPGFIYRRL